MDNNQKPLSLRLDWTNIGLMLMLALLIAGCTPGAAAPLPTPTLAPATATLAPSPLPPTKTLAPTLPPPTATEEPTLPPTATLEPTLPPPMATLEPTLPSASATVDAAQPTLSIAMKATVAAENASKLTAQCLGCHGPYEKLIASSVQFVTEKGETVNPHTTVDKSILKVHESGKGILNCTTCHQPHPQPLTSVKDVAPANVDYCFLQCHHQDNFTPCSACHKEYR